jgi:hypothetical protein
LGHAELVEALLGPHLPFRGLRAGHELFGTLALVQDCCTASG